jgi:hypothetical protein
MVSPRKQRRDEEDTMSNTFDQQVWRSEIDYRREQKVGRLSSWARVEGRRESLLHRPFRRRRRGGDD